MLETELVPQEVAVVVVFRGKEERVVGVVVGVPVGVVLCRMGVKESRDRLRCGIMIILPVFLGCR